MVEELDPLRRCPGRAMVCSKRLSRVNECGEYIEASSEASKLSPDVVFGFMFPRGSKVGD